MLYYYIHAICVGPQLCQHATPHRTNICPCLCISEYTCSNPRRSMRAVISVSTSARDRWFRVATAPSMANENILDAGYTCVAFLTTSRICARMPSLLLPNVKLLAAAS
jgi:hypothetical protein